MQRLILASASPRRQALLSHLTGSFEVRTSSVEEKGSDLHPDLVLPPLILPPGFVVPKSADPRLWAWRKAVDAISSGAPVNHGDIVLGADTVVVSRDKVLGKPRNRLEAAEMLLLLRGTDHYVITGYALVIECKGQPMTLHVGMVSTRVVMKKFTHQELTGYVATDEPLDKAGAYALQGLGGQLVSSVEGCHTSVIGLPICRIRTLLQREGISVLDYPESDYCAFCPNLAT